MLSLISCLSRSGWFFTAPEKQPRKNWHQRVGYHSDRSNNAGFFFLKECERLYNFGLGIDCNTIIWDLVFILVGAWKTTMLRSIWRIEAQIKWFQMGAIVETAREAVHVIFGKECSCLMQLF